MKKALLVGSQGVGDVEIVDSLADIVSLPALRLAGMEESVVEAPLELLSAPAEEAAEEVRKAEAERVIVENARKEAEKSRETLRQSVLHLKVPAHLLKLRVSMPKRNV